MQIVVEPVTAPTDEVRTLVDELEATLSAHYEAHQRHGLALEALFQPHIRFFVARRGGDPAGCGGIALLDGFAELKRMYVREGLRGQGIAAAILARLEAEARMAGYRLLRLETGTEQRAAMNFYRRSGFEPCGAFGDYTSKGLAAITASVFMEKALPAGTPTIVNPSRRVQAGRIHRLSLSSPPTDVTTGLRTCATTRLSGIPVTSTSNCPSLTT